MVTGCVLIGLGLLALIVLAIGVYLLRDQDPFFQMMAVVWIGLIILMCFVSGVERLDAWEKATQAHHGR